MGPITFVTSTSTTVSFHNFSTKDLHPSFLSIKSPPPRVHSIRFSLSFPLLSSLNLSSQVLNPFDLKYSLFRMTKVGLILLVVTKIMVLHAMAAESEAPMPGLSPLEVKIKREVQLSDQKSDKIVDQPVAESRGSSSQEEGDSKPEEAEAPDIRRLGKHHSTDKSVAGGGVILGGLVTVTFAAVFCYIRVTRKSVSEQ